MNVVEPVSVAFPQLLRDAAQRRDTKARARLLAIALAWLRANGSMLYAAFQPGKVALRILLEHGAALERFTRGADVDVGGLERLRGALREARSSGEVLGCAAAELPLLVVDLLAQLVLENDPARVEDLAYTFVGIGTVGERPGKQRLAMALRAGLEEATETSPAA